MPRDVLSLSLSRSGGDAECDGYEQGSGQQYNNVEQAYLFLGISSRILHTALQSILCDVGFYFLVAGSEKRCGAKAALCTVGGISFRTPD